jgi:heptosyltransferase-3
LNAGKILVVRGGAIGDFILTLPVFTALREQFPNAHLEVLGYAHIAALARAGGLVDAVRSIEARPLAAFFARNGSLEKSLQEFFAGFSVIISYLYDPDGIFQGNVARCSKAQFIVGPHRPKDTARIHATEVLVKPLERLAIFATDSTPHLRIGPAMATGDHPFPEGEGRGEGEKHVLQSTQSPLARGDIRVAVHPGSGSESKNWPEAKWAAALSQLLSDPNLSFLLIGGEAEQGRAERLAGKLAAHRVELAQNLPLVDLAVRLSSCTAFVGHDSGITHLAAALGLPVVALWGESSEEVWKPKGPKVVLVKDERGLSAVSVEQVVRIVASLRS